MNKKAQGQIITTILIILLVLAAIVIVWQVVNRTVTEGASEISAKADCIGASVTIESAEDSGAGLGRVNIRRNSGGPSEALYVYALPEGDSKEDGDAKIDVGGLTFATIDDGLYLGQIVKAGIVLPDGTLCDPIVTYTVTASTGGIA